MKQIVTLMVFFCFTFSFSQVKDEVYRMEAKQESPDVGDYTVGVLYLDGDGSYTIDYQQYLTKKNKNKNLIHELDRRNGTWERIQDTLYLTDDSNNEKIKFIVLSTKKIALLMDGERISPVKWKKING